MTAEQSAIIKAYREAVDTEIIHWACGLRDRLHEITDETLAKLDDADRHRQSSEQVAS